MALFSSWNLRKFDSSVGPDLSAMFDEVVAGTTMLRVLAFHHAEAEGTDGRAMLRGLLERGHTPPALQNLLDDPDPVAAVSATFSAARPLFDLVAQPTPPVEQAEETEEAEEAEDVLAQAGVGFAFMTASVAHAANSFPAARDNGSGNGQFLVMLDQNLAPGLVIDVATRRIVDGNGTDPLLQNARGDGDTLVLSGDIAEGAALPPALAGLDNVVVQPGSSYSLTSGDEQVVAGDTLIVNAIPLGEGETLTFDGSAESDGRFIFYGSDGADDFAGGAGDDLIYGLGGGDRLAGGDGADTFVFSRISNSTGPDYDTLLDFDASEDLIDLPVAVTGFAAAVAGGTLSAESFDDDLVAALSADALGAGQAVLFTPDAGDLAGTVFLVVDANGEAGYQAGEDLVIALPGAEATDISSTGIFI